MKLALALSLLAVLLVPAAAGLPPGHATIRLTATELTASRQLERVGSTSVTTMHLYNKELRERALGSAVLVCTYLGSGGVLGPGRSWCSVNYTLPRGTILAEGQLSTRFFYQLVVVGGTGLYANVHGTVVTSTNGTHSLMLLFALQSLP